MLFPGLGMASSYFFNYLQCSIRIERHYSQLMQNAVKIDDSSMTITPHKDTCLLLVLLNVL